MVNDLEEDGMTIFFGDVLVTANSYVSNRNLANALSKAMSNKEIEVTFGEDEKHITTKVANILWANRYDGFKTFLDEYDAFEPYNPESIGGYVYPYGLARTMYRRTECGAWAQMSCDSTLEHWMEAELSLELKIGDKTVPEKVKLSDVRGLRIGTIVEGHDAEFLAYDGSVYWLNPDEVEDGIQRIEGQAIVAWEEANAINAQLEYEEEFGV